ncbi:MAG: IS630 family transposase, partial [Mariniphaga sp.]|nr:IS630 family transposase [Mariniphaga sp.]
MLLKNISEAEIQQLNYERYKYPCPIIQKRIHAVYLKATIGMTNITIGKIVDLHRDTVGRWIRVYERDGFDALCQYNYGTNKSELEPHATGILKSFAERPPMNSGEAKARIEEMTGISRSPTQIRAFMKRNGLKYLKAGHVPAKADTVKQKQWVKETLEPAIEQAQKGECYLFFMDASHFILQPFICALWCMSRLFIKASSGRNRINVLGAVDAISKEVITLCNTTYINAQTIVDFLIRIKERYADKPVKIVLDNARYQHCKFVKETAKALGIELLFLPSYSPNLNIIERLWKFTKRKILYAKYYETPAKFHSAITGFFNDVSSKYKEDLKNLLTLKFQYFDNYSAEI